MLRIDKPFAPTTSNAVGMPAEGAAWQEVLLQLGAAAESGDLQAASRLLRDTLRCRNYQSLQERIETISLVRTDVDQPESVLKNHEMQLSALQSELAEASAVCKDVTRQQLQVELFPVIVAAAQAGNEAARSCFIDGTSLTFPDADSQTRAMLHERYATYAAKFVVEGLQNGDWRIVMSLLDAYSGDRNTNVEPTWLADLVQPSAAATYGLVALERNAAAPRVAVEMDEELRRIVRGSQLTERQVAESERWARDAYKNFFHDAPFPFERTTSPCSVADLQ